MSAILPEKARDALRSVFAIPTPGGGTLPAGPFTLARLALLSDLDSPLTGGGRRRGLVASWCATLRVLASRHPEDEAFEVATDGPAAYVAASLPWAEKTFGEGANLDAIAAAAETVKAEWNRLWALDPDDRGGGGKGDGKRGEESRSATASSPTCSATPSPCGAGASTRPCAPPSDCSCSASGMSGAPPTAGAASAGSN